MAWTGKPVAGHVDEATQMRADQADGMKSQAVMDHHCLGVKNRGA